MKINKEEILKYNLEFDSLLLELKQYAKDHKTPIVLDEGLKSLLYLIDTFKIHNVLEIGTAIGYSAINMARVISGKLITIERDPLMQEQAKININKSKLSNIELIENDALSEDINFDIKFDLIFIDAAKAQSIKFFEKYRPYLSRNGFIVTDNLNFHGVTIEDAGSRSLRGLIKKINLYIEYLKNNQEYSTIFLDIGDGISITTLK